MGIRGELFSTRFACDSRTYFFNVKQNRNGDVFLSIVESKPSEGESFDRRSIVIFGEQMEGFLKSFQSALKYIDKTGIKVAPDPTAYSRADSDEEERPRKSEESRPRRDSEGARETRSSSYREHSGPDTHRRAVVRTGPPSARPGSPATRPGSPSARGGASSTRTAGSSSRIPSSGGRGAERAGKAPSTGSHGADKPIKRIVVRKAKKSDSTN